jgi:hypothetical protein
MTEVRGRAHAHFVRACKARESKAHLKKDCLQTFLLVTIHERSGGNVKIRSESRLINRYLRGSRPVVIGAVVVYGTERAPTSTLRVG